MNPERDRKRLNEHNDKKSTYTKYRGPYELIYYEACRNENDARQRKNILNQALANAISRAD